MIERDEAGARLEAALEMAEMGVEIMRQQLRRKHPEASVAAIERLLSAWLRERPGAEFGDAEGVVRGPLRG